MLSVIGTVSESGEELLVIIGSLLSKNEDQAATIHRLETQNEQLEQRLHWLEGQFYLLRHKRFGTSSECTPPEQGKLFKGCEASEEQESAATVELETISYERKKRGRKPLSADLPRERIEYELPESEQYCPECGEHIE